MIIVHLAVFSRFSSHTDLEVVKYVLQLDAKHEFELYEGVLRRGVMPVFYT